VHDSFPTPFSDEVLDQFAGKEVYLFIDELLGYHQVRILEEDHIHKGVGVICIQCDAFFLK
jgi:hypothetical protein